MLRRGVEVDAFECDLIVRDTVIIELKALSGTSFTRAHFAHMKTYLNSLDLRVGLIANFGKRELQIVGIEPE